MSALEVTSLAFAYDGALAVRDVSISVQPGEIVALLGANGAGKSTTVRMIAGVLSPQKGAIRFGGEALTGTPSHHVVRRGIYTVQAVFREPAKWLGSVFWTRVWLVELRLQPVPFLGQPRRRHGAERQARLLHES